MDAIYINGVGRTPVRFIRDGRFWVCEGIEYDYLAQGDNRAEALWNFKIGFQRTVEINLDRGRALSFILEKMKWQRVTVKIPGPIVQRIERHGPNV